MTDASIDAPQHDSKISRRTIVRGAAWAVPVVAVAAATPLAAASGATPTDIAVTLQPTPPVPGAPVRLTYRGTAGFDLVPFPAGSSASVVLTGQFTGVSIVGATITSQSGTNPVSYALTITDLNSFYVQGTGQDGASVSVTITDAGGATIGSDFTLIGGEPN